nr:hypothetical protein [uncultured Shinella sp.]
MAHPPVTVRLDPRRLDQLKAIASAMNLSNAGAIAAFIREKIAAGIIPADIPGTSIRKQGDGIAVSLREDEEIILKTAGAQALASTVREVIAGNASPTAVNVGHDFAVQKQGTGLKIALPFGKTPLADAVSFPPDLALDLADLLEKAAA